MSLQLSCVPGNQQVTANLSWVGSQPSQIIDYMIFYYASGSAQISCKSTQTLSCIISGLTNDTIYDFYAVCYQAGSANGQTLAETALVQCIPGNLPSVPTGLTAIVSSNGNVISQQIQLSWNASTTDTNYPLLNYNIYTSLDGASYNLVAQPSGLS